MYIVSSVFLKLCIFYLVLLRSQKNKLCFLKIEIIVVILSITYFLSSKDPWDTSLTFYTNRAVMSSGSFSEGLVNCPIAWLTTQTYISGLFSISDIILYAMCALDF